MYTVAEKYKMAPTNAKSGSSVYEYTINLTKLAKKQQLWSDGQRFQIYLIVLSGVFYSAYEYLSDLKQGKEFTPVQNVAFELLQDDVNFFNQNLSHILETANSVPPMKKRGYGLYELNQCYSGLDKIAKSYRTYWTAGNMKVNCSFYFLYLDYLCKERLPMVSQLCKKPGQKHLIVQKGEKQIVMQSLGKELNNFFRVSDSRGKGYSNEFFWWFGGCMNDLVMQDNTYRYEPYKDNNRTIELLMATRMMGNKYFIPSVETLYTTAVPADVLLNELDREKIRKYTRSLGEQNR